MSNIRELSSEITQFGHLTNNTMKIPQTSNFGSKLIITGHVEPNKKSLRLHFFVLVFAKVMLFSGIFVKYNI